MRFRIGVGYFQVGDGPQQLFPMAKRRDPALAKIGIGEVGQFRPGNFVFGKKFGVTSQPESLEPCLEIEIVGHTLIGVRDAADRRPTGLRRFLIAFSAREESSWIGG